MKKILKMEKAPMERLVFIILFTIAIIITTICVCNIIRRTDFTAATPTEWNYLYEQVATFEEKGIEPFYTVEDIKITVEGNSVKIESQQCGAIFEIDNKRNLKEVKSFDKAYLNGDAVVVIISLLFADVFVALILFIIGVVVLALYLKLLQWCINLAKKEYKK